MLAIDGLNLLDCIRGSDVYTGIIDYPEEVIKILDFGLKFNIEFIKKQRKLIKPYKNGRFNFYQTWTPGETIFIRLIWWRIFVKNIEHPIKTNRN